MTSGAVLASWTSAADRPRRPPRLLVASSSEGLRYAKALQKELRPECVSDRWDEGFFKPGDFTLEALIERSVDYDGAIVLATSDDRVVTRGLDKPAPRDNLILEYGLFVATFGRHRALLVVQDGGARVSLPSDLFGLTFVPFHRGKSARKSVSPVAATIKVLATQWNKEPLLDAAQQSRMNALLELLISELRDRSEIVADFGLHVFLVDRRYVDPQLVRVARKRLTAKSPQPRSFARGEAVVGTCWLREEEVLADFTSEPFASATADTWRLMGDDARLGMDWEEFEKSRRRFKAVGAVPITGFRAGTGFAGALSYNLGWEAKTDVESLRQPEVTRILSLCAEAIAAVLGHYT